MLPAFLPTSDRSSVFLSYSQKDKRWLEDLRAMLAPLVHNGVVDIWWDGKIKLSQEWRVEIDSALVSARIGVLLVSPNFLASNFIVQNELPYLIEAAAERKVTLCWVLLSACLFEKTPLARLQAAHDISRPLDTLGKARRNAVLKSICQQIEEAARSGAAPFGDASGPPEQPAMADRDSAEIPDPVGPTRRMTEQERDVRPHGDGPSLAADQELAGRFRIVRRLALRRWLAAATGLALVVLLVVLWLLRPVPAVALLAFRNLSGDSRIDFFGAMLLSRLSEQLRAGYELSLVSDDTVARVERELRLLEAESFSSETMERLHENLPADVVVFGSYRASPGRPGQVEVVVNVQEAPSGKMVTTFSETGSEQDLLRMIDRLGSRLHAALGVGELSPAEAQGVRASLPSSREAIRFYTAGLAALRISDAKEARGLFAKAVEAEPEYPLARLGLAKALQKLGYDRKAAEEAKQAYADSGRLPLEEKLQVEAHYRESMGEWTRAIEIYRELDDLSPNRLKYGLRLAAAQTQAGLDKDALSTIKSLRPQLGEDQDPRLDLAAAAAVASSDSKLHLQLAKDAEEHALRQKARLLVAQALVEQGKAYLSIPKRQEALDVFERAREIYHEFNEKAARAWTLSAKGDIFQTQGNHEEAYRLFKEAHAIFRGLGYRAEEASVLSRIGVVLAHQRGEKESARENFESAMQIYTALGNEFAGCESLINLALAFAQQGDLKEARPQSERALTLCREARNRLGEGGALGNLADVLHSQGDLDGAKKMFEEALGIARETGDRSDYLLTDMARLLASRGEMDEASKKFQEALDLRRDLLKEPDAVAESRLAMASFFVDKGDPTQARSNAELALAQFREQSQPEQMAKAHAVLARALAALNALPEAKTEISAADLLSAKSESSVLRMTVQLAAGQVRAAAGEVEEARRLLRKVGKDALSSGYVGLELEARLELGKLEAERGDRAQGRELLTLVEKDARARGFGRIAREAQRLG